MEFFTIIRSHSTTPGANCAHEWRDRRGSRRVAHKMDEVERLFAEWSKLVAQEHEVLQEMNITTDTELELQLRSQHQELYRQLTKIDKSRVRSLGGAVDLLSGYDPVSLRDFEAAIRETERLVNFLKKERDIRPIDSDTPGELVSERGIVVKLLERAVNHLRFLYDEKNKFPEGKPTEGPDKPEPPEKPKPPDEPEPEEGFMAWFDKQETAVKAALIAAIVSIIGALATIVVAVIRRRD